MIQDRFVVHDGLVTDMQTGLVWLENPSLVTEFPVRWQEGLGLIDDLNRDGYLGHTDWRLPWRRELFSLISHATINPCLPAGHPFLNVATTTYWTGTSCARLPEQAWFVHLGGARVFKGAKDSSYMIWPVRGHRQHFRTASPEATAGVLVDDRTGLMWTDCADWCGMVTWAGATEVIALMNREQAFGFGDWRLPDVRDLESLVDLTRHSPALPAGLRPQNVQAHYWSATTSAWENTYAWCLYLQDGAIGVGFKMDAEFYVWPVRGVRVGC